MAPSLTGRRDDPFFNRALRWHLFNWERRNYFEQFNILGYDMNLIIKWKDMLQPSHQSCTQETLLLNPSPNDSSTIVR